MRSKVVAVTAVFALLLAACSTTEPDPPAPPDVTSPPNATTTSTPQDLGIEGLEFGEFLEVSYSLLTVRDPQGLSSAGLAETYGLRNDLLNDLSDPFIRETQSIQVAILHELGQFDRNSLAPKDRISYDSYEWYLEHLVDGHRFMYHDWPVHHFVNSYNFNLIIFLTDEHAVDTVEDAEDYVARLGKIDIQVGQVIDGLQRRVDAGVLPVRDLVDLTVGRLGRDLGGATSATQVDVTRLSLYTTFAEKLSNSDVPSGERQAFLDDAQEQLETSFVPAWLALADYMRSIRPLTSNEAGVNRHPNGKAYYEYLLRGQTSADLTPQEVHDLGLFHVDRVQRELREALTAMGYPGDQSLVQLRARAASEAGGIGGDAAVSFNELLIEEAESVFRPLFELWPPYPVQVIGDPGGGGYYVRGSVDGSRLGAFYASTGGRSLLTVPTINYHEAVPGHHTQIAIAQSLDLPSFQRFVTHNGYVEGWALYAERLAHEIGLYEDDPYGNIGRLELELLRAVRLVVDTGIHYLGWSASEARDYMSSVIPTWSHEVERYMVLPGQATGYMVGMLEILRFRSEMQDTMGDDFDIAEFHTVILGSGSQPLVVLDQIVSDYMGGDGS